MVFKLFLLKDINLKKLKHVISHFSLPVIYLITLLWTRILSLHDLISLVIDLGVVGIERHIALSSSDDYDLVSATLIQDFQSYQTILLN